MKLSIAKLPNNILRTKTNPVTFPLKKSVRRLMLDMISACKRAEGIGLAAPQVAKSLSLALIYLEELGIPEFFLFNPVIGEKSKETESLEEGCLSVPGVFGLVERPTKITVKSQDEKGNTVTEHYEGWVARVIQHEIDHLNNILIVDKFEKITQGETLLPKFQEKK